VDALARSSALAPVEICRGGMSAISLAVLKPGRKRFLTQLYSVANVSRKSCLRRPGRPYCDHSQHASLQPHHGGFDPRRPRPGRALAGAGTSAMSAGIVAGHHRGTMNPQRRDAGCRARRSLLNTGKEAAFSYPGRTAQGPRASSAEPRRAGAAKWLDRGLSDHALLPGAAELRPGDGPPPHIRLDRAR